MTYYQVEFQGRKYRVPALKYQGRLWFHWLGETHVIETAGAARKSGGGAMSAKPGLIAAPMPGKITQVAVAKGARVVKGQALVVMEAMKMEYTLQADRDGVVAVLAAVVGAQVALGDVLVKVEEA